MKQLIVKTEYSFGRAYGRMDRIIERLKEIGCDGAVIADEGGTWGHVQFQSAMKKAGLKAGYGAQFNFVRNAKEKSKTNFDAGMKAVIIAKNADGMKELYHLATLATDPETFFYVPRLELELLSGISENCLVLISDNKYIADLVPKDHWRAIIDPVATPRLRSWALRHGINGVRASDNLFPASGDNETFQIFAGRNAITRNTAQHILNEEEFGLLDIGELTDATEATFEALSASPSPAKMMKVNSERSLSEMCVEGAIKKKIDLNDPTYASRLKRELDLIKEKDFEDYFFIIGDAVQWAKERMLVGPARGSSCGSLVCYLLDITSIDPIRFDLLFERFIDINRSDLPDIDIDFPEDRRDLVFDYLKEKYGTTHVARIGSVNKFKPKSAIGLIGKEFGIPYDVTKNLKDAILERSTGDSRAQFCLLDTFNELDIGRAALEKYPALSYAAAMEAHASHAGQHAAGIAITMEPVETYCSVDLRNRCAMIDKYDAEALNILKIDALGLRTLSVIQECLDMIGKPRDWLVNYPIDDDAAFKVIRDKKFAGIFQFAGYALQSLSAQMVIDKFEDFVAITALARPGPLNSGSASHYLARKAGKEKIEHLTPQMEEITKETYGIVIYQEQVMKITREVGKFSWEDTSHIRKAMSKSLGKEFFDRFLAKFEAGAAEVGIEKEKAQEIFSQINTHGAWSFNRSHAVAYGMVSYWCCVLKAHYPKEWALSCLRHAKDDEEIIDVLKEVTDLGIPYIPFDRNRSADTWSIRDGTLYGGYTAVKGVGEKKAKTLIKKREEKLPFTPAEEKLLAGAKTPYDNVYECREMWKDIFDNPAEHMIYSPLVKIGDLKQDTNGIIVFIAKILEKDLRDANEMQLVERRGGRKANGQTKFLSMILKDDTGQVLGSVGVRNFESVGRPIIEEHNDGDYYIVKGKMTGKFRKVYVDRVKHLGRREIVK